MSSTKVPYDNNNGLLYDGYDGYDVEKNALITEEQLNRTEKDIRDYLEKMKQELTEYMNKLEYVSYSYNQNLSTVEQNTAQANINFPGRIQGLAKHYFDTYYQDALNKVMNNLNLINGVEENLIAGNARIYYLTEKAERMQYGIPIFSDYFVDVAPQDLFYHADNYNNQAIIDEIKGLNYTNNKADIPDFDLNSEQKNHIYHFVNYLQIAGNSAIGLSDHSAGIRGYIEYNPRPNLSYFCPEVLSKIKAGDILYCPTNKNTYIVTEGKSFPGVRTWYNSSEKSLFQVEKSKQDVVFKTLYNPSVDTASYKNAIETIFKSSDWLNIGDGELPDYKLIPNTCIYYTTSISDRFSQEYEYGCLAISCVPTSSLIIQPSLWEYEGSTLFGGGEEYPNSFTKLFGANNFITRPVIGDVIYNPLSQEYRRVVRDLTKSERFLSRETYLTEPIIQYTNGELDNSLRALATYGRGTGLFAIPKEYDICLTPDEINNGRSNNGRFRKNFARLIKASKPETNKESYESTDDTSTTSTLGRKQALSAIIYDHDTGEIYPAKPNESNESNENSENNQSYTEPYKCSRILFNTYFMLPGILQEAQTTNFGNIHPLRLAITHPGDIIQYNEHSYQVTTQPYLRVFTFAEALQYLKTLGYIDEDIAEEAAEQGYKYRFNPDISNKTPTLLGDLLQTILYTKKTRYLSTDDSYGVTPLSYYLVPKAETNLDFTLAEGFKYYSNLNKIQYGPNGNDYYEFSNIDQWLASFDNSELVQAYALNHYNNGTILDYLDDLYHRLFTNLDRPIIVEAIPLGDDSCFGQGDSAYQVAVNNGYSGSEEAWLASLRGKSAYQSYVDTVPTGEDPYNEEDWIASLKGADGAPGIPGANIISITSEDIENFNHDVIGKELTFSYGIPNTTPTITTIQIYNGSDGENGPAGKNGADGAGIKRFDIISYFIKDSQSTQLLITDPDSPLKPLLSYENVLSAIFNTYKTTIPVIWFGDNTIGFYNFYFQGATGSGSSIRNPTITFGNWLGNNNQGTLQVIKYTPTVTGAPNYYLNILGTDYKPSQASL